MGYKLVYFDARGKGEVCRLMFAYAGQEYEDVRIKAEEWPAIKQDSPFGQLPYLEVDGVKISQSNAMGRLLAKRFGLVGSTDEENAVLDMVVDCTEDIVKPIYKAFNSKSEDEKAELLKEFNEKQLPEFMSNFEKMIAKGDGKFLIGEKMTWADITLANLFYAMSVSDYFTVNIDNGDYPKLCAMKKAVEAEPNIAEWMQKRPKTQH